jgi:hypothetical protein
VAGEPSVQPTSTPEATALTPTPTEVGGPTPEPCDAAIVTVAHGPVEAAIAGRVTVLTVTNTGAVACRLFGPNVELSDSRGRFLIAAGPAGIRPIDLAPGAAATTTVHLAGWCDAQPAEPLALGLLLDEAPAPGAVPVVAAGGPFPAVGTLPPCLGPNGTDLSATHWGLP